MLYTHTLPLFATDRIPDIRLHGEPSLPCISHVSKLVPFTAVVIRSQEWC